MGHVTSRFSATRAIAPEHADECRLGFELFVRPGFSEFELSAVIHTLGVANELCGPVAEKQRFYWRCVSDRPGLVKSANGMMVRAEPAVQDHGFMDVMVVIGGSGVDKNVDWLKRVRATQRRALPVVLFSDAATTYIKATNAPAGRVTTHWRDAKILAEVGYYPNLTNRLSENSDGIVTSAGAGSTAELIIGLIAPMMKSPQVAELSNRLLLHTIRKSDADQPRNIADNVALFDSHVTKALQLMEDSIAEPMLMCELVREVGVSTRQLERMFRKVFDDTPARFYRRLRTKRARDLIEETLMPLIDVSVATGFGSLITMSIAVREEYGQTPTKLRARRKVELLKH